jgi:hypothetical protein
VTGATGEQPQVTATVSPPDPPRSRWGAIPHHLGRARTSTVILSLLFLAVGALWLNIRPDPVPPAPASGNGAVVDQPATPDTAVPTTPSPTTEPVPTTSEEPTPTEETPTTAGPTDTTTPEGRTTSTPPAPTATTPAPTAVPTASVSSPPG